MKLSALSDVTEKVCLSGKFFLINSSKNNICVFEFAQITILLLLFKSSFILLKNKPKLF